MIIHHNQVYDILEKTVLFGKGFIRLREERNGKNGYILFDKEKNGLNKRHIEIRKGYNTSKQKDTLTTGNNRMFKISKSLKIGI